MSDERIERLEAKLIATEYVALNALNIALSLSTLGEDKAEALRMLNKLDIKGVQLLASAGFRGKRSADFLRLVEDETSRMLSKIRDQLTNL